LRNEDRDVVGYSIKKATQARIKKKQESKRKILEILKEKRKIANNNIQEILNCSDVTATNYLDELEKEGTIEQVGKTGRFVYYQFKSTAK